MAAITQEEFNAMLQVAIAQGLPGGNYTSKYSGEEIDAYLGRAAPGGEIDNLRPGRNLLDNAYFPDPINQRGLTEYTAAIGSFSYCIDRWTLKAGTVTVNDGYITWGNPRNAGSCMLVQYLENAKAYAGKQLTFSFLTRDGHLYSTTIIAPASGYVQRLFQLPDVPNLIFRLYYPYENDASVMGMWLRKDVYVFSLDIVAAKLELGSQQTLAHYDDASGNWVLNDPPPDRALELAKCQMYYWKSNMMFASQEKYSIRHLICNVHFPVKMRAVPSVTLVSLHGTQNTISTCGDALDVGEATVNPPTLTDEGFNNAITGFDMDLNAVYAFKVIADSNL